MTKTILLLAVAWMLSPTHPLLAGAFVAYAVLRGILKLIGVAA